jgi:EAL domain-containing protein (putative c-di-GMP-specific phosphodiesterase class I)/GGDEF domain-containing protein
LINRFFDTLPKSFRFWDTEWYVAARNDYNNYRYNVLIIAYILGATIPIVMLTVHLASGYRGLVINYIVTIVSLLLCLGYLYYSRKVGLIVSLTLMLIIIAFIPSCILSGNNDVFVLIFLVYPILAFQLSGTKKGLRWVLLMIFTSLCVITSIKFNLIPSSTGPLPLSQLIMGLASYGIIGLLTFTSERRHEKNFINILQKIVYDDVTMLPESDAILYSMDKNTNYLIAIIRIENFNEFLSLFGYEFSDDMLQFVVKNMREIEREYGFQIFRLRGYEFGILLPLWDVLPQINQLEEYLHNIWKHLSEKALLWDGNEIRLIYRISGAIANDDNKIHVLSNADKALKDGSRKRKPVTIYDEKIDREQESALATLMLFTTLTQNHEKKWFKALFQPIIDTNSRKVVWYESLVRIRNIQGEYEPPVKYLPIARSTGMDTVIAQFMLENACSVLEYIDQDISINITLQDMLNEKFLKNIIRSFKGSGKGGGTLIFEILERDELADVDMCLNFINTVKSLGCKIAIDDFGVGHSNFYNLLNLPIDIVKIDGFLITQMLDNAPARSMVEGITSLLSKLGIPMVAEFVDNEKLFTQLKALNVNYVQGFHFGKPGDHYF